MTKEILAHRLAIGALAVGLLISHSRFSTLALRLQILETGVGKAPSREQASNPRATDEVTLLKRTCFSLRGKVVESGSSLFCDLPNVASSVTLPPSLRAPSSLRSSRGGGIEVHYADRSKRQCLEVTGEANCDQSKAITCPNGVSLVRVAPTEDGLGLRNRYSCN